MDLEKEKLAMKIIQPDQSTENTRLPGNIDNGPFEPPQLQNIVNNVHPHHPVTQTHTHQKNTHAKCGGLLLVQGTQLLSGSARGCSPRHQGRGR